MAETRPCLLFEAKIFVSSALVARGDSPSPSLPRLHREKRKRDFTGKMWRIPPPPPLSIAGAASSLHRNTNKLEERRLAALQGKFAVKISILLHLTRSDASKDTA